MGAQRVWWVILGCFGLACATWAAGVSSPPLAPDEWVAPSTAWSAQGSAIALAQSPDGRPASLLRRRQPLPDGDWRADLWFVHTGERPDGRAVARLDLGNGRPGLRVTVASELTRAIVTVYDERSGLDIVGQWYVAAGSGPVCWLKLLYSAAEARVTLALNGQQIRCPEFAIDLRGARLAVGAMGEGSAVPPEPRLLFYACGVRAGAQERAAATDGPNLAGWGPGRQADAAARASLASSADRLRGRLDQGQLEPLTRAHALAALAVAERAVADRLSPPTWSRLAAEFPALTNQSRAGAALLLQVAAACADDAQRVALRGWLPAHFAALADVGPREDPRPASLCGALLDPWAALQGDGAETLGPGEALPLADQLVATQPELALLLMVRMLGEGWRTPAGANWLLPRFEAASPTYADGLRLYTAAWVRAGGWDRMDEPDVTLAVMAWRLAERDLMAAVRLGAQMTRIDLRAELFEAIGPRLSEVGEQAGLGAMEACFKELIAGFRPTRRDDSPVPHRLRLARLYFAQRREPEAQVELRAAQAFTSQLPSIRTRDALAIARLLGAQRLPGAEDWLTKAAQAAAEADAGQQDYQGETIYLSHTAGVVKAWLDLGATDQAVAMARRLAAEPGLADNASLCYAALIHRLLDTDLPLARKLLAEMGGGASHGSAVMAVAKKLAPVDLPAALAVLDDLADGRNAVAEYAVRRAAGQPANPTDLEHLGQAIARVTTRLGPRADAWRLRGVIADLDTQSPDAVWALEPHFGKQTALFYRQLMESMLHVRGWRTDPLWQRWSALESPVGVGTPWSAQRPRDIFRASEKLSAAGPPR